MEKTIIVIGAGKASELSAKLTTMLKNEYGEDLTILSQAEANERGILQGNIPSVSEFKLEAQPIFKMPELFYDKHALKNDCKKGWRKNLKKN